MSRSTISGATASSSRCPRTRRSPISTTPRSALAERLDGSHYRDDILRLLFICCHPDLPATQQIALALRIVSGLTVKQIARAFLVAEAAMEQRITRAKAARRRRRGAVRDARRGGAQRAARRGRGDDLSGLQRGLFGQRRHRRVRAPLCEEAIRLARLLLRLFQTEPEIMGLTALMLLQHARAAARFDAEGAVILLDDQDRCAVESEDDRRGAGADRQGDAPSPQRALSDPGGDRRVACPRRDARRYRLGPDRPALRRAGGDAAVAGGDAQPRRRRVQGARRRRPRWT